LYKAFGNEKNCQGKNHSRWREAKAKVCRERKIAGSTEVGTKKV